MKITLLFAIVFAPILHLFEKFIFQDWDLAIWMIILVGLDTATGLIYSFVKKDFSDNKAQKLPLKIVVYGAALIMTHVLSHAVINGEANVVLKLIIPYVDSVLFSYLMGKEVLSINTNCTKLGYRILPKFITKLLENFDENGNYIKPNPQTEIKNENITPNIH